MSGRRPEHGSLGRMGPRAVSEHYQLLSHIRHVDAVGSNQRDGDLAFQLGGHPGEGCSRHHRGNGGDARLMPANAGVDNGGTGLFHLFPELDNFLPARAVPNQVQHTKSIYDDKVRPTRLAYRPDNFCWEADAVLVRATPLVRTLIGMLHNELQTQEMHTCMSALPHVPLLTFLRRPLLSSLRHPAFGPHTLT